MYPSNFRTAQTKNLNPDKRLMMEGARFDPLLAATRCTSSSLADISVRFQFITVEDRSEESSILHVTIFQGMPSPECLSLLLPWY